MSILVQKIEERLTKTPNFTAEIFQLCGIGMNLSFTLDDSIAIYVNAKFNPQNKALQYVAARLVDSDPGEPFTQNEIRSIADYVDEPSYISIQGITTADKDDPKFSFQIYRHRFHNRVRWECNQDFYDEITSEPIEGVSEPVNFNTLAGFFGYSLPGDHLLSGLRFGGKIDTQKLPEAYQWVYELDICPAAMLHTVDRLALIRGLTLSHNSSERSNEFSVSCGLPGEAEADYKLQPEKVSQIERVISNYRNVDLNRMESSGP